MPIYLRSVISAEIVYLDSKTVNMTKHCTEAN